MTTTWASRRGTSSRSSAGKQLEVTSVVGARQSRPGSVTESSLVLFGGFLRWRVSNWHLTEKSPQTLGFATRLKSLIQMRQIFIFIFIFLMQIQKNVSGKESTLIYWTDPWVICIAVWQVCTLTCCKAAEMCKLSPAILSVSLAPQGGSRVVLRRVAHHGQAGLHPLQLHRNDHGGDRAVRQPTEIVISAVCPIAEWGGSG